MDKVLDRMVREYDAEDGVYDREAYLDYLTEQVGRQTAFADMLEEVDLAVGNDDVVNMTAALREAVPPKKKPAKKTEAVASAFSFDMSIPF